MTAEEFSPGISHEMNRLFVDRYTQKIASNGIEEEIPLSNGVANLCESEIEKRLLIELFFASYGYGQGFPDVHDSSNPFPLDPSQLITLAPQYEVGPYRIDIAIFVRWRNGQLLKIAVECDGHDFHERTKEQAERDKKRDREIQKAGYLVFRFTGSEIFRLAKSRAQEVADHCEKWLSEVDRAERAAHSK